MVAEAQKAVSIYYRFCTVRLTPCKSQHNVGFPCNCDLEIRMDFLHGKTRQFSGRAGNFSIHGCRIILRDEKWDTTQKRMVFTVGAHILSFSCRDAHAVRSLRSSGEQYVKSLSQGLLPRTRKRSHLLPRSKAKNRDFYTCSISHSWTLT